jgi:hypothetical protein
MTINAYITGASTCTAEGITATGSAPLLALCRKLIEAGHDPNRPLHAYRGDALALKVRSIGEVARLWIAGDGVGFRYAAEPVGASPIRPIEQAAITG